MDLHFWPLEGVAMWVRLWVLWVIFVCWGKEVFYSSHGGGGWILVGKSVADFLFQKKMNMNGSENSFGSMCWKSYLDFGGFNGGVGW